MSYPPPSPNPYQPPAPEPFPPAAIVPGGGFQTHMEYMRAYNFIFENPAWMTTVLLLAVVSLVAVVPGVSIILNLLYLGYQFEVIEWLLKSQGRQYPTFEFGRIGDYISRGLWPFLVNMVVSLVLVPLLFCMLFCSGMFAPLFASVAGEDVGTAIGLVVGAIAFILFFAVLIAMMYVMVAMILRSGLSQDFATAFQIDWIKDFVAKMWLEMTLAGLFMMISSMVISLLGFAACCIGLFAAIPIVMLAYAHLLYQLYVVYLAKGGQPVTVKSAAFLPPQGPLPT